MCLAAATKGRLCVIRAPLPEGPMPGRASRRMAQMRQLFRLQAMCAKAHWGSEQLPPHGMFSSRSTYIHIYTYIYIYIHIYTYVYIHIYRGCSGCLNCNSLCLLFSGLRGEMCVNFPLLEFAALGFRAVSRAKSPRHSTA